TELNRLPCISTHIERERLPTTRSVGRNVFLVLKCFTPIRRYADGNLERTGRGCLVGQIIIRITIDEREYIPVLHRPDGIRSKEIRLTTRKIAVDHIALGFKECFRSVDRPIATL